MIVTQNRIQRVTYDQYLTYSIEYLNLPATYNRDLLSVRHEVNGKHRVLAAYIIFTLEEAYRYNDRQ